MARTLLLLADSASAIVGKQLMDAGDEIIAAHFGSMASLPVEFLEFLQLETCQLLPICTGFAPKIEVQRAATQLAQSMNCARVATGDTRDSAPSGSSMFTPLQHLTDLEVEQLAFKLEVPIIDHDHIFDDSGREDSASLLSMHREVAL